MTIKIEIADLYLANIEELLFTSKIIQEMIVRRRDLDEIKPKRGRTKKSDTTNTEVDDISNSERTWVIKQEPFQTISSSECLAAIGTPSTMIPSPSTFTDFIMQITMLINENKTTQAEVIRIINELGIPAIPAVSGRLDLIPEIYKRLGMYNV